MRLIKLFSFLGSLFLLSTTVSAQVPAMTFSIGYSHLNTQKSDNLFYSRDGSYLDADFAWRLPLLIPLQAGIGVSGSGYYDRQSIFVSNSDFYDPYRHIYSDVGTFEIEPRIGIRLGRRTGFFILPRAGAGLLINSYAIDQTFVSNGNTYLDTREHSGAAFEIRPAVQAGYCWGPASAGVDASYLWAWGDFGGLGHRAEEFRVGAFFKLDF